MKPPCETCISYAVCRQKETIDCTMLYDYTMSDREKLFSTIVRVIEILPNITTIKKRLNKKVYIIFQLQTYKSHKYDTV